MGFSAWGRRLAGRVRALLRPRPMEPEERALRGRHLRAALGVTVPGLAIGALVTELAGSGVALSVLLAMLPVAGAYLLERQGRLEAAGFVLMATILGLGHWLLYDGDGLQDIAVLLYPVLVLVGSLLLETLAHVVLVTLSATSLCLISWGQAHGSVRLVDESLRGMIPQTLIVAIVVIVAAAVMSQVLVSDLRSSARRARRHERALSESEERYRLISEVISDYTFSSVVDATGKVRQIWVAGAFERIAGYPFDEYLARGGWHAALHPEDREEDARARAVLHANRRVTTEVRVITRSGEVRWVRVYAHPVWSDEENRLVGIYGAVQDITDSRLAKTERERLIHDLETTNAELERFTYTASHELRSPLVTVQGFLSLVERDAQAGDQERLREDIERIRDATGQMQRLLDELLELSRIGRVVNLPTRVDLGELAREAVGLVAGRITERGVGVRMGEGMPVVQGDRARLLQVLQNLVDNAVKFSGDRAEPIVEIGARREDGQVLLHVSDNGIGIEPRHQEQVFELFDKLDARSEGTGVGLALARRIVELHGGRVWVESEGRGRGATFWVSLPDGPADPTTAPGPSRRPGRQ